MSVSPQLVGPQDFIDRSPIGARQRLAVAMCFLVMLADGMEVTIASHVFPSLMKDFGAPIGSISAVVALSAVGLAIGALASGRAADRFGRKPVIITGVILFGIGTFALAASPDLMTFAVIRIVSCLGIGGVIPVTVTLVTDLVPRARRAQMSALAFAGVPFGTIVGAYLATILIPTSGWRSLLLTAGVIPIVIVIAFILIVPESPSFVASRGGSEAKVKALLRRVTGHDDAGAIDLSQVATPEQAVARGSFHVISSRALLATTILLWIFSFFGQGVNLLIVQFLPTMLQTPPGPGLSTVESGNVVAAWGWGAVIGGVLAAFALKRFDRFYTIAGLLVWSLIGILVIGLADLGFVGLVITAFLLGLTLPPALGLINVVASLAYPVDARATGVGAVGFVGRVGNIASGAAGGALLAAGLGLSGVFLALTAPVALCVGVILLLRRTTMRRARFADDGALLAASSPVPTEPTPRG